MQSAAIIVLPVHNRERTLRPEVLRILDLAEILHRRVVVAIVDDGSRDGTYETACELARQYPQVRALRQRHQRGLGAALEQVRVRLGAEQVVAHDGVTAIDLEELAEMLSAPARQQPAAAELFAPHGAETCGSRRMISPRSTAASCVPAPRSLGSFRWLRLDEPVRPRRVRGAQSPAIVAIDA